MIEQIFLLPNALLIRSLVAATHTLYSTYNLDLCTLHLANTWVSKSTSAFNCWTDKQTIAAVRHPHRSP